MVLLVYYIHHHHLINLNYFKVNLIYIYKNTQSHHKPPLKVLKKSLVQKSLINSEKIYHIQLYFTLIPAVNKVKIKNNSPNRPVLNVATALSESAVAIAPLKPLYHKTRLIKYIHEY